MMPRATAWCSAIIMSLLFLEGLTFTVERRSIFVPLSQGNNSGDQRFRRMFLGATRQRCHQRSTALHMVTATKTTGSSLLVGNLASTLSKLFWISPKKAKAVKSAVARTVHAKEVALIAFCGWALVPIFRLIYNMRFPDGDFKDSNYYRIPHIISQIAQIGGLVYAVDILTVVLGVLGFKIPKGFNVCAAKILYLLLAAYRFAKFKRYLLIEKRGKAGVLNKIANAGIAVMTALSVLDILSVQTGLAVQSLFAFGSASTLIVTLGSQNLASQIVNGLAIASTGMFYEGERVVIGEERVFGTVQKMGLLATDIRGEFCIERLLTQTPGLWLSRKFLPPE